MRLLRVLLLSALLATPGRTAAGPSSGKHLAKALSTDAIQVEAILHSEFQDLDGDGVKETVVHGRGNLKGAAVGQALVLSFQQDQPAIDGQPIFLPSNLAWDRFVAIFSFDRKRFRWIPRLLGTYRREDVAVTEFDVVTVADVPMVRLAYETEGQVHDRLFRMTSAGAEAVFGHVRGTWVGEGMWVRSRKVFTAGGLPNPFKPSAARPGLLCKTRYRWTGERFEPEYWSLGGYGFEEAQVQSTGPTADAGRKVRELQRAADRGLATSRLSLEGLGRLRFADQPFRVAYERDAFGVLVRDVNRRRIPHFYLRPLHGSRGDEAVWVSLDELRSRK
jgi:hypothetical protein